MSEWVSVEDKEPPKSHDEIVGWNGKWSRVCRYLGSMHNDRGYFYSPHDELLGGITHWMPLPEPPK